MKKKLSIISIFLLFALNSSWLQAQQMTTMGTDFWVTSIGTEGHSFDRGLTRIELLFASPRDCSATITNLATGWDTTIAIAAYTGKTLALYHYLLSNISETEFEYGFHITTTDTVSLFAYDGRGSYVDLSNILPTQALGKEYIIQTHPVSAPWLLANCSFAIITTKDSTTVQIALNGPTNTGNQAGETIYKFFPAAGTCFQINSDYFADLSGTRIISNKSIAVFQGNHNTTVFADGHYSSDGHLFVEQAVPIAKWGRHFIVPHSGHDTPDKVRITAKDDPCFVYRNGELLTYLIARGTYEYLLDSSSVADYITSSKAVGITLYNTTRPDTHFADTSILNYFSSRTASSTTIHPIKNATKHTMFQFKQYDPYNSPDYYNDTIRHRINIVAHTSDTSLIFFDTINIGHLFTPIPNNTAFSIARIQDANLRVHTLTALGGSGFNAYATYPYNWVRSCPLGAGFPIIQNTLHIGDYNDATLLDTTNECTNQSIAMSVVSEHETDSIRWLFGDGAQDYGANTQHTYSQAGTYTVTAIVYASCQECFNAVDTLQTIVKVFPNSTTVLDTVIAACDSLLLGENTYYANDTALISTATNTMGCDSTTYIPLIIHHSYTATDSIAIPDTITFTWIDGNTYSESTDSPYVVLQAHNGCDSTIHLHLIVLPTPPPPLIDSTAVWVPNTFTPGEDINNRFSILCNDIITAEVSIFNRLGLHICTFDGLADSWDGTYKGAPCPQGAYVYLITYTTVSQPSHPQRVKGTVLLLR